MSLTVRHPMITLVLLALISVPAVVFQGDLKIDSRAENILPATNPRVAEYARFRDAFGTDDLLLIGFEAPDGQRVVDPKPFALLSELTERLASVPEVDPESVISLANVKVPSLVTGPFGPQVVQAPLVQSPPRTQQESDALAKRLEDMPLVSGLLVSEDLAAASAIVALHPPESEDDVQEIQIRAMAGVRSILADLSPRYNVTLHVAGGPATKADFITLLARDMGVFVPLTMLLIGLVLALLFRSWRGVILPLATVLLAMLWTMALIAATGHSINTVTSLLPPLILAVGVGDAVHLLTAWQEARRKNGREPRDAVTEAVEETFGPCLLTTLTTGAGFGSLLASPIGPIGEFGMFAAAGSAIALVLSFTLLPALLSLFPGPPPGPTETRPRPDDRPGVAERISVFLATTVIARPWQTLAAAVLVVALAVGGAVTRLEVEVDFLRYFKSDHPTAKATEFFSQRLAGPVPLELVVEGPPGTFGKPAELRRLAELQAQLETLKISNRHGILVDPVDRSISCADFVKLAHKLEGGPYTIPDDPHRIATWGFYAALAEGGRGARKLLSQDAGHARISARMHNIGSHESQALIARVRELFHDLYAGDPAYSLTVTGSAVIFLEISESITVSQLQSFGLALGLVFLSILVLFRSLRIALLSLVPNVFPICMTFGLMAAAGMTLNMNTAMVSSIAIGIAVDDTIHFLSVYTRERDRSADRTQAVLETCRRVGTACATTSMILCAGFGVSILASFYPTIHFGVLSAATIAAAYVGDFVILPALIVAYSRLRPPDQGQAKGPS